MSGPRGEGGLNLRLARLAGLTVAAVLVAAGAGGWPTWRWLGRAGLAAMVGGGSAALIAFAASLPVVLLRARRGRQALAIGFLLAGPVRVVVTLGLAGLAAWRLGGSRGQVFIWAAVFYLLFLTAEVVWLAGILRGEPGQDG